MVHIERLKLSNGLVLSSNHRSPVHHTFGEIYRAKVYGFLEAGDVKNVDVVLDIGANIGLFSLYAASVWPNAAIHAFEPAADSASLLAHNVSANGLADRITCHRVAVAGRRGSSTLHLDLTSACDSLLPPVNEEWRARAVGTSRVDVIRLQDAFGLAGYEGRNSVVKVDAEGSEMDIFANAPLASLLNIQRLTVECHEYLGVGSATDLTRLLRQRGMRASVDLDAPEAMVHAQWDDSGATATKTRADRLG